MEHFEVWCYCGHILKQLDTDKGLRLYCPKHGFDWDKPKVKEKIGRYSGKSGTPHGKYEDR